MAGEALDLQIVIDTLLQSKGFNEAQAGLKRLAAATNDSADSTRGMAEGQKVSTREIKVLTAELLRSIGVTQGAGAAGRVAAESFLLMGSAANLANFAMAGIGLLAVTAIPSIISLVTSLAKGDDEDAVKGAAKAAAKALEDMRKEIIDQLPRWEQLAEKIKPVPTYLKELVESARTLALQDQAKAMDLLADRVEDLTGKLIKARDELNAYLEITPDSQTPKVAALRQEVARLEAEIKNLVAQQKEGAKAANAHMTILEHQTAGEHRSELAKKGLRISEEAYTAAIKQWEFAEKSAAIARDKEKKQQIEEIAREGKIIALINQEAHARRDAAKKAGEDAADEVAAQNEKDQQILDSHRSAAVLGLQAASSLFAKNKAIAIAAAIAETYKAAAEALSSPPGPPFTIPLMAATVAMGLANVANIQKASPGFDDPFNDILASKLGRKSAADFVQHFGAGFREGMGAGGSVTHNTIINRGTTMNVTANGVIGSRTAFRSWLEKEMTLAERVRARKTI